MELPFDRVRLFSPEPVADVPDGERFELVVLPSRRRGIAWHSTKLRRAVRGTDVLFAPYVLPPGHAGRSVVAILGILEGTHAHTSLRARSRSLHSARSARRADAILVHSASTRDDVVRHYRVPPDRIEIVHLGVTERFRPGTPEDDLRARALVNELTGRSSPYLLFVGKLSRRRNVPLLLQALAQLDRPDLQLLLVGPNSGTPELHATISRLGLTGRVHHVRHLEPDALAVLYRGALAFVLLTEHEGFSATILEALASGCPVLTLEHPALHEADVASAVVALQRRDPPAIANALRVLEHDDELRSRLRTEGLRVAASLTFEDTAVRTMDVLARVARGAPPVAIERAADDAEPRDAHPPVGTPPPTESSIPG